MENLLAEMSGKMKKILCKHIHYSFYSFISLSVLILMFGICSWYDIVINFSRDGTGEGDDEEDFWFHYQTIIIKGLVRKRCFEETIRAVTIENTCHLLSAFVKMQNRDM